MMSISHWRLALVYILVVPAGLAQTPTVQDLQTQLRQFEESTQKTIQDLKAQIASMQQAQKGRRCRGNRGGFRPVARSARCTNASVILWQRKPNQQHRTPE